MSTTRYLCPLDCGWHHDEADPDFSDPTAVRPFIPQDWATGIEGMVAGFAAGQLAVVERVVKAHLGTHELVEWVTAVTRLQRDAERAVEEYGGLMSAGSIQLWDLAPDLLGIYPLAKRIEHGKRHGGRVLRRRVIVLGDWEEV